MPSPRSLGVCFAIALGRASAEVYCSDLWPAPSTADFIERLSSTGPRGAELFRTPVFYPVDEGLVLTVDEMMAAHGQVEVRV
jgi:hypothetical protein